MTLTFGSGERRKSLCIHILNIRSLCNILVLLLPYCLLEELIRKGKGYNLDSFTEPWKEMVGVVQRYITSNGWYDVVRPR